jgi:hypothetical protein
MEAQFEAADVEADVVGAVVVGRDAEQRGVPGLGALEIVDEVDGGAQTEKRGWLHEALIE